MHPRRKATVVVAVATDAMSAASTALPARMAGLRASAAVLGVHRVEHLGYADSGHGRARYPDPPGRKRFVRADTEEAARRLAALLREENTDVVFGPLGRERFVDAFAAPAAPPAIAISG